MAGDALDAGEPQRMSGYPAASMAYNSSSTPSSSAMAPGTHEGAAYMPPPTSMAQGNMQQPVVGTCLICFRLGADVLLEPCGHQFHAGCIERWLTKDKVCPNCWIPTKMPRRIMPQYAAPPAHAAPSPPNAASGNAPQASGSGGAPPAATTAPAPAMRKGKWTVEESAYCDRLIEEFKKGNLPLAEGTTLRTFLSKLLNCDPMRISKKYTGDQCIGKIIFRRREDEVSKDDMELIRKDLAELEKTYLEREQYNQRRREKRLESELSRDKNRYLAARSLGYSAGGAPTATTSATASRLPHPQQQHGQQQLQHQHHQQQQQPGYPQSGAMQPMMKTEPGQQQQQQQQHHAYGAPTGRGGLPVQPPRHPPAPVGPASSGTSHLFNSSSSTDHSMQPMMGIAQNQTQPPDVKPPSVPTSQEPSSGSNNPSTSTGSEAFPRVSSIDSFSCLFPRVASIENFQSHSSNAAQQHGNPTSSGFGSMSSASHSSAYGGDGSHGGYEQQQAGEMVKSISIGDGLNAYFPRIQSLEQLSSLLQEHAPNSPRSANANASSHLHPSVPMTSAGLSTATRDQLPGDSKVKDSVSTGGERQKVGAEGQDKDKEEQRSTENDSDTQRSSGNSSSTSAAATSTAPSSSSSSSSTSNVGMVGSKRLSPSHVNPSSSGMNGGNQIQIPKPLNKMPRSSSGIFPRVPSMDKLPRVPSIDKLARVPSVDKLPRVASLDKLPRIPSMDKLHTMGGGNASEQRIPRVPSNSDMLSRFGSSDHLSSFPSFSNLSTLSSSASYDKLSSLGTGFKMGFPRNSSIEDILSLVASSESTGMPSAGSHLQLSALAAVAGEESSHLAAVANDRKRRLETAQQDTPLTTADNKKGRLSA